MKKRIAKLAWRLSQRLNRDLPWVMETGDGDWLVGIYGIPLYRVSPGSVDMSSYPQGVDAYRAMRELERKYARPVGEQREP